jgi:hypothetical protein
VLGQQRAGGLGQHRAAAQGQHAVVLGEGADHRLGLDAPELRLAVLGEDVGDGLAGQLDDVRVDVPERHAQLLGQQLPHGGLARAGRADHDDDSRRGHRAHQRSCSDFR